MVSLRKNFLIEKQKYNAVNHWLILLVSLGISLWLTYAYYPGVFHPDAYRRWDFVNDVYLKHGMGGDWHNPIFSLWMWLTFAISGEYGAISFLQSFLFFFSSLLLINKIGNYQRWWALMPMALFILLPVFQGYSVYQEPSLGVVIGLNFWIILLLKNHKSFSVVKCFGYFFIYFFIFLNIFAFRENTITILPILVFIIFRVSSFRKLIVTQMISLTVALTIVLSLPFLYHRFLNQPMYDAMAPGLTWETVQMIKITHNPKYDHYLDYAEGSSDGTKCAVYGDVKNALRDPISDLNETFWGTLFRPVGMRGLDYMIVMRPDVGSRIKKDYLNLIVNEPNVFAQNKIRILNRVMGISKPLKFYEFEEDIWGKMYKYGCGFTPLRHQQIKMVKAFMEHQVLLRRPFFVFLSGLVFFLIAKVWYRNEIYMPGVLLSVAIFYYGAFFITAPSYEFRYFFCSFYLIAIVGIVLFSRMIEHALKLIKCRALISPPASKPADIPPAIT